MKVPRQSVIYWRRGQSTEGRKAGADRRRSRGHRTHPGGHPDRRPDGGRDLDDGGDSRLPWTAGPLRHQAVRPGEDLRHHLLRPRSELFLCLCAGLRPARGAGPAHIHPPVSGGDGRRRQAGRRDHAEHRRASPEGGQQARHRGPRQRPTRPLPEMRQGVRVRRTQGEGSETKRSPAAIPVAASSSRISSFSARRCRVWARPRPSPGGPTSSS